MKTVFAKPGTVRGDWFVVDASDQTLGRLASQIAHRLKGKHKADYSPHVDMGDHIVVVNAQKIRVTGRKLSDKIYYHHTGYVGHLKELTFEQKFAKDPKSVLRRAVRKMLPKNFLNQKRLLNMIFVEEGAANAKTKSKSK